MIEALKEIGEYALKKQGKNIDDPTDMLEILIDDPESNPKKSSYKNILLIQLEQVNGKCEYNGIDIEEYSRSKLSKYLYKQGSPKGPDVTPTSRVTNIESTFKNTKILPWFKNYTTLNEDKDKNFLVKSQHFPPVCDWWPIS